MADDGALSAGRGTSDPGVADRGTTATGTAAKALASAVRRVDLVLDGPGQGGGKLRVTPVSGDVFHVSVQGLLDWEPGPAVWTYQRGEHQLLRGEKVLWRSLRGEGANYELFTAMMKRTPGTVPASITGAAARTQPAGGPKGKGGAVHPLKGDHRQLLLDPKVRKLLHDLLERFGNVKGVPAADQLTAERLAALTHASSEAKAVADYTAQAWEEFGRAGGGEAGRFGLMAETVVTQWAYDNATVVTNQLEIRRDRQGLGLYHRGDWPLMYYGPDGRPVLDSQGVPRDQSYQSFRRHVAVRVPLPPDNMVTKFLNALRLSETDETVALGQAIDGYWRNSELAAAAVWRNWEMEQAVKRKLDEHWWSFTVFLCVYAVATVLEQFKKTALFGKALKVALHAFGKFFLIVFTVNSVQMMIDAGVHLSKVTTVDGKPVDSLSQSHLDEAAALIRRVLVELAAFLIEAGMLTAALAVAKALPGPPDGPMLTAAPVGAPRRALAGAGTAEAAGAAAPEVGLPLYMMATRPRPPAGESGMEQEQRELSGYRVPNKDQRYIGRKKLNFNKLFEVLWLHRKSLQGKGKNDPMPGLNDKYLRWENERFIQLFPKLRARWWELNIELIEQRRKVDVALKEARGDKAATEDLLRQERELVKQQDELTKLGNGRVGQKQFDLFEAYLDDFIIVLTDITQRPFDPVHNFKLMLDVQISHVTTAFRDVWGIDFDHLGAQRIFKAEPISPAPPPGPKKAP